MRIEAYFQKIQNLIEKCPLQALSNLTTEKRSTHTGLVRGEIHFLDGSTLHFREFVDVEICEDRLMYVYQYLSSTGSLVFRYDNTGHHKKLNLPTYPHHKHDGTEQNIIAASPCDLHTIFEEIQFMFEV